MVLSRTSNVLTLTLLSLSQNRLLLCYWVGEMTSLLAVSKGA